jgi:hypothetical protein
MRSTIVNLRGRHKDVEDVIIHVLLESRHQLGWKGWMMNDKMDGLERPGPSLLYLAQDWVEYGYIDMELEDAYPFR